MKKTVFTGAATAIVTPLNENGVDYESFGRLIEWQIAEGIDAIVACGTTGEASTLTDEEHKACIKFAVEKADGERYPHSSLTSLTLAPAFNFESPVDSLQERM